MEQKIIKQGDFTLEYIKYCDSYFLYHKDFLFLECEFNELFDTQLMDCVFKLEPDPEKAAEFITKLYKWGLSQQEALEKLLDEVYGKEKQKILDEFQEEKQKILDEFQEEKQKILDEFQGTKQKILDEVYGEKI